MSQAPLTTGQDLWRDLARQVLADLMRRYGSDQFDQCEDAVQEALLAANQQWADTEPRDARAWLITTARRRYVDAARSDKRRRDRELKFVAREERLGGAAETCHDDTLRLIELCCHPALPRSGQVPLTLRAVGGLTTAQIAHAYALPEPTVAQRVVRAKRRLRDLGAKFPEPADVAERVTPVLSVLYLMFTEAHHTASGTPATDTELAEEAIRLTRLVVRALPNDTEANGLLALMLLTHARRPGRISGSGELIPLDEQDRSRWNRSLIHEGLRLLDETVPDAIPSPYLLQACIAGLHAQAPSTQETDWAEIRALYRLLRELTPDSSTLGVNAAVAEAMVNGPQAGLAALARLRPAPARAHSVAAHLHERVGDVESAANAYREALKHTTSTAEQNYLQRKLVSLRGVH